MNDRKIKSIHNPFRQPIKRKQFDQLVLAYYSRDKLLFNPEGKPHRLNAWAAHFWAGFNGVEGGLFQPKDQAYRNSGAYVFYRAGQELAKNNE